MIHHSGMILAAGYGERLRPETDRVPKPLFKIGRTNMIRNAVGYLVGHGISKIAINLHHLGGMIIDDLAKNPPKGAELFFVEEKTLMGTAGGIKGAERFIGGSDFVVINADVLTDLNLEDAIKFHESKNALATLVTRKNPSPEKIGSLAEGEGGRLARFLSSKSPAYSGENGNDALMFTGIQVLSKAFWGRIPSGRPVDISRELYGPLVSAGEAVYVFNHDGYWADIGTPESYRAAWLDVENGKFKPYGG